MVEKQAKKPRTAQSTAIEKLIKNDDLRGLSDEEREAYYLSVCESLGLDPTTMPLFYYTARDGRTKLYATRTATDQLRDRRHVSIEVVHREFIGDEKARVYCVYTRATMGDRTDEALGAVSVQGLHGDNFSNALMKAETKAKRRVTLSICGSGFLDETEVEDIPGAHKEVPEEVQGTSAPEPPAPSVASRGNGTVIDEESRKALWEYFERKYVKRQLAAQEMKRFIQQYGYQDTRQISRVNYLKMVMALKDFTPAEDTAAFFPTKKQEANAKEMTE